MITAVYILLEVGIMGVAMCSAVAVPTLQQLLRRLYPARLQSVQSLWSTADWKPDVATKGVTRQTQKEPFWLRLNSLHVFLLVFFEVLNLAALIWVVSY